MIRAAICALALAGCIQDHYECKVDRDCTILGGRCEADHTCTGYDESCELSQRRYTHAAGHHDECFTGLVTPVNYCAADQPPAPDEGCAHEVCKDLPSCCTATWGDACVMAAQLAPACNVSCDLRIAIVAQHNALEPELWDLRFTKPDVRATRRLDRQTLMGWLAPRPGEREPRLAAMAAPDQLVLESTTDTRVIALDAESIYHDVVSIDLDRDLRDTIALDSSNSRRLGIEVLKVDTGEMRDLDLNASAKMAFGAAPNEAGVVDIYPDVVVNQGSDYRVDESIPAADQRFRSMNQIAFSTFADNTPGSAGPVKSFAWADIDGDGKLDIVGFGSSLQVFTNPFVAVPTYSVDCDPPSATPTCAADSASYTGAVWPTAAGTHLLVAPFDLGAQTRKLFEIDLGGTSEFERTEITLPPPQPACVNCSIQAVIVRDLDGDHVLDILLIDSQLSVLYALSTTDPTLHTWVEKHPMMPTNPPYTNMRISISGMPISP